MMNQYPAKPMMDQMAQYGRYGDSMLVHMNPVEVAGIASLSPTGSLTINPVTGQPEAFLPILFGALGGALKLGTLGTAALTGVGTAAATGDIRRGLLSAVTAGVGAKLFEGIGGLFDSAPEVLDTGIAGAETAGAATVGAETAVSGLDASNATANLNLLNPNNPNLIDPRNTLGQMKEQLAQADQLLDQSGVTTMDRLAGDLQQSKDLVASVTEPAARTPNMSDAVFGRGEQLAQAGLDRIGTTGQLLLGGTSASLEEQMKMEDKFERAARARMAEAEEKKAQSTADLQLGYAMAQPDAPRGRSPMRDRMDRYIRDYGTDLYAAGGGQMPTMKMQVGGVGGAAAAAEQYLRQQYQQSGSSLPYDQWVQETYGNQGGQGGGGGVDTTPAVTTDTLGPINVPPTDQEAAVLAAARGNTPLSPQDQQILEGYYNRYEQERQNRASQITDTGSDFDLSAIAASTGMFGYNPTADIGGIDPVTIQAGLRGDYVIRPPDDYMPGFEAEFSYFQDDPNAPFMPYRGYRPVTGGITSEGDYFDPILDRGAYKKKLAEYYATLASYGLGEDRSDTEGGDGTGGGGTDGTTSPEYEARIQELMARGMTREEAIANQQFAVESGYDLNGDGIVTNNEYATAMGQDLDGDGTVTNNEYAISQGYDLDSDGTVTNNEYAVSMGYDIDDDGTVTNNEYAVSMGYDADGDGTVTDNEYAVAMGYDLDGDGTVTDAEYAESRGITKDDYLLSMGYDLDGDGTVTNNEYAVSMGYDLDGDGTVTDAEYAEATGLNKDESDDKTAAEETAAEETAPEETAAPPEDPIDPIIPDDTGTVDKPTDNTGGIDLSTLPPRIRELIESGQLNLDTLRRFYGGLGPFAGYNPAQTAPPPPKDLTSRAGAGIPSTLPPNIRSSIESGQFNPASIAQRGGRGRRSMSEGGEARGPLKSLQDYLKRAAQTYGGINTTGQIFRGLGSLMESNIPRAATDPLPFDDFPSGPTTPTPDAPSNQRRKPSFGRLGPMPSTASQQAKPIPTKTPSFSRFEEGGDVRLQTSLGEARVPGGGIAEVETQFTARPERAEMPTKDEMDILAMAVMGEVSEEQQDMIVSAFTEKYGAEMYAMLRSEILRSVVPDAQTEGMIRGNGGGMDDKIPGMIGAQQPVAVSPGEFIVPADVVSDLGDGSSDSGADELYAMMERVRKARGGNGEQPPAINARTNMPA